MSDGLELNMFMPSKEVVMAGFECKAIKDDFGVCTCVMNDKHNKE